MLSDQNLALNERDSKEVMDFMQHVVTSCSSKEEASQLAQLDKELNSITPNAHATNPAPEAGRQ